MTDIDTADAAAGPAHDPWHHALPHLTPAERLAKGKAQRAETPRSAHSVWHASPERPDPIDLLEEQAQTRVPALVPIRYGRMAVSPFAFYRGAAYIMASDLATAPRTSLNVQLCGDAHLSNFGSYAAPDRRVVFSVNDFDETLRGPFEWDVKRLAASFEVAGRQREFDDLTLRTAVTTTVRSYREAMREFAAMRFLDLWNVRLDVTDVHVRWAKEVTPAEMREFERDIASAHAKDNIKALHKLTYLVDGEPRIVSEPPLIVPIEEVLGGEHEELVESMQHFIRRYRKTLPHDRRWLLERYRYVHAAQKVVGVGSVGTRAWILFLLGRDQDDPLFLQFKEAQPSVLEPFLGKSPFAQHGQRVVEGQRMIQAHTDIMLGWERAVSEDGVERDYYLRQLWDAKTSAPVETMPPHLFELYGELCGWALARGHARSGDAVAISAYLGAGDAFDRSMLEFARSYADQNEADFQELKAAIASGRVEAHLGI